MGYAEYVGSNNITSSPELRRAENDWNIPVDPPEFTITWVIGSSSGGGIGSTILNRLDRSAR